VLCVGRALPPPAFCAVGTLARELGHGIQAGTGSVDAERDPDAYADAGGDSYRECGLDVASGIVLPTMAPTSTATNS